MEITQEQIQRLLRKKGFIRGLLLGCILFAVSIISYYFLIDVEGPWWSPLAASFGLGILVPLLLVVLFVYKLRQSIGGYWKFRDAVTGIFFLLLASYIVLTIGRDVIFAHVIEPDMLHKTELAMIRSTTAALQHQKATPAQIDAKIADTKKQFDISKNETTGSIIQGVIFTILFLFLLAVVFAAIFRREPPYTIERVEETTV